MDEVIKTDETEQRDERAIRTEILTFHDNVLPHFQSYWERAKINIGLEGVDHWTEAQINEHTDKGRVPLNFPVINPKLQALQGFEKDNRTKIVLEGEGQEDELNAEIGNEILRRIENVSTPKYKYLKSDLFRDAIIPCHGIIEDYEDKNLSGEPEIKLRRVAYNQLVWDTNFTDREMDTCSRQQKFEWVYKDDLVREFQHIPDIAEKLKAEGEGDASNAEAIPLVDLKNYYDRSDDGRLIIKKIKDYKKVNKQAYELHNILNGKIFLYEEKLDAEQARLELTLQVPKDKLIIKPVWVQRIEYVCMTPNVVLQMPEIIGDEFPHTVLFSFFQDGKWWTPADIGKDPQQYIDRLFSQIDYSIGTDAKSVFILYPDLLHKSQSITDAMDNVTGGGILLAMGKPGQGNILAAVNSKGANPDYFTLLEVIFRILEDAFGGKNFTGVSDPNNQTATGINSLIAMASRLALNLLDGVARFDDVLGRKLVKRMLKVYNYEKTIKVLGESMTDKVKAVLRANGVYQQSVFDPSTGFLKVNSSEKNPDGSLKMKPLAESNFTVTVSQISARQDEKDIQMAKLLRMKELGYEVPAQMFGDLVGITATQTNEIVQATAERDRMMAEAQANAERLQEMQAVSKTVVDTGNLLMKSGQNNDKQKSSNPAK